MSSEKHEASVNRIFGSEKRETGANDEAARNEVKQNEAKNEKSKYCSNLKFKVPEIRIESSASSSSREFPKSETIDDDKFTGTFSSANENRSSTTEKQLNRETSISENRTFYMKSVVIMILNKLKEICSECELRTDHFKNELAYQGSLENVIEKSKSLIEKLKIQLDDQQNKLTNIPKNWASELCARKIRREDRFSSDRETLEIIETQSTSDSSQKTILLGEDGRNEITEISIDRNKRDETSSPKRRKILEEGESDNKKNIARFSNDKATSPILGSRHKNRSAMKKPQIIHKSTEISNKFQENPSKNLFEEAAIENDNKNALNIERSELEKPEIFLSGANNEEIGAKSELDKSDKPSEGSESTAEMNNNEFLLKMLALKSVLSDENASSRTNDSSSTATIRLKMNLDDDRMQADAAGFRFRSPSNVETIRNGESVSERSDTDTVDLNRPRDGNVIKNNLSRNGSIDIGSVDTKSADSMDSLSTMVIYRGACESDDSRRNERAKASLLFSTSSESWSSEDSVQFATVKNRRAEDELERRDSDDEILEEFPCNSRLVERAKIKPRELNGESDEKLGMGASVVLERLSEEVLEKHAGALEKSRERLDYEEIKRLIDLNALGRDRRKASGWSPISVFKKPNRATAEPEDTLLDHLKRVENCELTESIEEEKDAVTDCENKPTSITYDIQSNEELMMEADRIAKSMLLNSDDSDSTSPTFSFEQKLRTIEVEPKSSLLSACQNVTSLYGSNDEEKREETKLENNATMSAQKSGKKRVASDEEPEKKRESKRKSAWKWNRLLNRKFSLSASEDEIIEQNQELVRSKGKVTEDRIEDPDTAVKQERMTDYKTIQGTVPIIELADSNSDVQLLNSDSTFGMRFSNTDSWIGEEMFLSRESRTGRWKNVRKETASNTDSDDDSDPDYVAKNFQGKPVKRGGRKNIRKVMEDEQVALATRRVAKEEAERLERIAHRQKLRTLYYGFPKQYDEMLKGKSPNEEALQKLVLDFNTETKEELVTVHSDIVKCLKPHQVKGIKFMWDVCFESLERIRSSSGSGCIIAHCMGLGKSLQVIALLHTLLNHEETGVKAIAIVCPMNTILNWNKEFNLWLRDIEGTSVKVYELTKSRNNEQKKWQLESWHRSGGVLLISYAMFRKLTCADKSKMPELWKKEMLRYLIDPGPDLVVCDEGHLLKNEDTALSRSMRRIKTLRRIALTGTPLQNNLIEYHCMMQFVKPNLLETKNKFLNRFGNPINNGQYDNSTKNDVRLMKQRAYVLHKMLESCVQRLNYSVLTPLLPPKQEYVIFVRLSDVQIKMYRYYVNNLARCQYSTRGSLFQDYQTLQRIWTHPVTMRWKSETIRRTNEKSSEFDFISDETESTDSEGSNDAPKSSRNVETEIVRPEEIERTHWWTQFIESDHLNDISISSKLMLLFGILKKCELIGDKLVVFSQSLHSLNLIEHFLVNIDKETQKSENSECTGHRSSWLLGLDYYRFDGKTSPKERFRCCEAFNSPTNTRAMLFLISTHAGGLGINLTAANRVILFDASWNPSPDVQSIFRVYRFGQKKPCYVYRFLAAGTMEEKIYNRQVTKLSLSCRVLDEQQIERHYRNHDLVELYTFRPNKGGGRATLNLPKDRLLAEIFLKYKDYVENYHEHDSLLENKSEEELNEQERKQAWLDYEKEKAENPMISDKFALLFKQSSMYSY
ncbi:uncharacterized protein LOC117217785 isoform X1 [Megalopta genalis]|uniref:uncharacterized protein LOC117217785 isoform X1 n=1 Tax=Megalopta genalis TaxID=115081 RepID=UPI003FD4E1E4